MEPVHLRLYKELKHQCAMYNVWVSKSLPMIPTDAELLLLSARLYLLELLIERNLVDKIEANVAKAIKFPGARTPFLNNIIIKARYENNGIIPTHIPINVLIANCICDPLSSFATVVAAPFKWCCSNEGNKFWVNAAYNLSNDTYDMTLAMRAHDVHDCLKMALNKFHLIKEYYDGKVNNKSV